MSDDNEQRYAAEVGALRQIIAIYRTAQFQDADQHLARLDEIYEIASRALDGDSLAAQFGHLLRRVIGEARSKDGVGTTVSTALTVAEHLDRQLAAFRRIIAELRDDGITEVALVAAERALNPRQ